MKLDVIVTPKLLEDNDLEGCLCTVVDVLRATSTIITALVSGAIAVYPCLDVAEAKSDAAKMDRGFSLLGGEEMGLRIPGFDLGNSPLEYLAENIVEGKAIFLYTSNGTGAIRRTYTECAQPVYIAALLNASAVSSTMVRAAGDGLTSGIKVLCSGRYGKLSAEDLFCAGLLVEKVGSELQKAGIVPQLGDGATIATGFAVANKGQSLDILASSEHGRYLESIGFASDLEFASQVDAYDAVPIFDGERAVLLHGNP